MVDLDGDGREDVLSGEYWPGDLWIFRGQGGHTFAKGEQLRNAAGEPVNAGPAWESEHEPQMDSLAAVPFAQDWDGDGDLDLLVGNTLGRVIWIPNEGCARAPDFSATCKVTLEAGGAQIRVPGGHAGPVVADWDGDGRVDLLVGAGDGSVWLYRDTATSGVPVLARGRVLVKASEVDHEDMPRASSVRGRSGEHARLCVTDWDGDGLVDLLVGDQTTYREPDPVLTFDQIARRDELRAKRAGLQQDLEMLHTRGTPADGDPELVRLEVSLDLVETELDPLEADTVCHGWVWLYRRRPGDG